MMKAEIKASTQNGETDIMFAGRATDIMYLLAAIISQIGETTHISPNDVMRKLNRSVLAFETAKAVQEAIEKLGKDEV